MNPAIPPKPFEPIQEVEVVKHLLFNIEHWNAIDEKELVKKTWTTIAEVANKYSEGYLETICLSGKSIEVAMNARRATEVI